MLELDQDLFFYSEQRHIKILGLNFISFLKKKKKKKVFTLGT